MQPIKMLNMMSLFKAMDLMKPMAMKDDHTPKAPSNFPRQRDNSKKARSYRRHRKIHARIAAASRRRNRKAA